MSESHVIDKLHAGIQALRLIFEIIRLTAVSLVVSVLAVAALLLTSQSLEALRVIAEGFGDARAQLISTEVGAVLVSLILWYSARVILYALASDAPDDPRAARRLAARYLPRIYGALPLAALAAASFLAGRVPDEIGSGSGTRLWILTAANVALLVGFLAVVALRRTVIDNRAQAGAAPVPQSTTPARVGTLEPVTRRVFGSMIALWFILFVAVWITDGSFAEHAGVIATALTCMATWVPTATAIQYLGAKWDFPVLRAIALCVALIATVDWNENHYVQRLESPDRPRSFDQHVAAWLATRPDRSDTASYPVFIVAADGGGIRNSYLTASVLGALADSCPLFGEHLLAISAVSGGAIGAAVHRALLSDFPVDRASRMKCALPSPGAPQMGARQAKADSIVAHDLLSPVVAAGLYMDAAQKFIPWPGIGSFDRARALERSAERSYAAHAPPGSMGLARNFYSLADSTLPLLYLNTTSVEEGKRMVIAGAEPDSIAFHPSTLFDLDPTLSVRLSTAAVMSARFPFVTPEAVVGTTRGDRRFVDGGYFDNSGATTALDIASALKRAFGSRVRPVIVHIGISDSTITRESNTNAKRLHVQLNEVMAPVRALFAIRDARGAVVVKELAEQALVDSNHVELIDITTGERTVPFVLGWLMSKNARVAMRKGIDPGAPQSGDPIRARYERIRALLNAK